MDWQDGKQAGRYAIVGPDLKPRYLAEDGKLVELQNFIEAKVREARGNHFNPSVMTVLAHLGNHHPGSSAFFT